MNRDLAEAGSPAAAVRAWIVYALTALPATLPIGVLVLL